LIQELSILFHTDAQVHMPVKIILYSKLLLLCDMQIIRSHWL